MPLLLGRCFRCSRRISSVIRCGFSAKKVNKILTGLQPTGVPHLGNYLGVIRPLCRIQSSPDVSSVLITIADLHALTSTGGMNLSYGILELSAALIACFQQEKGDTLKKNEPVIFLQSAVRGHTELAWILASCCSLPVSDAFCVSIWFLWTIVTLWSITRQIFSVVDHQIKYGNKYRLKNGRFQWHTLSISLVEDMLHTCSGPIHPLLCNLEWH